MSRNASSTHSLRETEYLDTSGLNDYDSLGSLPGVGPGTGIPSTPQVIFALK